MIRIYEDVFNPEECQGLIDLFNSKSNFHEIHEHRWSKLTAYSLIWDDVRHLESKFLLHIEEYKKDVLVDPVQWPADDCWEFADLRIKRYVPDIEEFPLHVDALHGDVSKRFLAFFVYLDDNKEGETVFHLENGTFTSPCKKGNLLIFPPYWPWPHEGRKPIEKPKYILGGYMRFKYDNYKHYSQEHEKFYGRT